MIFASFKIKDQCINFDTVTAMDYYHNLPSYDFINLYEVEGIDFWLCSSHHLYATLHFLQTESNTFIRFPLSSDLWLLKHVFDPPQEPYYYLKCLALERDPKSGAEIEYHRLTERDPCINGNFVREANMMDKPKWKTYS